MITATRMSVADLMTEKVFSVQPEDTIFAARDLMWELQVRHVPVVDEDGDLVGLLSHRDLLQFTEGFDESLTLSEQVRTMQSVPVRDLMTDDIFTVEAEVDIREAAQQMLEFKIGCLPVVEGQRLVGILTEADFVKLLATGE